MELAVISRPHALSYRAGYHIAKRLMDLLIVFLSLPFVLPLMALCALAIRLDSSGPVLFVQERVGRGGQRFNIYKFRTMQHNLDSSAHQTYMRAYVNGRIGDNGTSKAVFKPFHQSQVTRVGRILRRTSLDELPQLINVLKGEMSLVGPRPNVSWEVEEYRGWHKERLEVLPGITGLAQINGRSGVDFDTIVKYDVEYIRHQSFGLDVQILWYTVLSVVSGRGAH